MISRDTWRKTREALALKRGRKSKLLQEQVETCQGTIRKLQNVIRNLEEKKQLQQAMMLDIRTANDKLAQRKANCHDTYSKQALEKASGCSE